MNTIYQYIDINVLHKTLYVINYNDFRIYLIIFDKIDTFIYDYFEHNNLLKFEWFKNSIDFLI